MSHPAAASTDAKALRQMAAEAEAWVNQNDAKFVVARQRLLVRALVVFALASTNTKIRLCAPTQAKGLYIDGAGAFKAVVGEASSFEVRRKAGLKPNVDIPLAIELRNDVNELVSTKIEAISGVAGARRVLYRIPKRGVYTCNVYALPPAATSSSAAGIVVSGSARFVVLLLSV